MASGTPFPVERTIAIRQGVDYFIEWFFGTGSQVQTTIAVASDGASLPQSSIFVTSTAGFQTTGGLITINFGGTLVQVTYAGITGNELTGCALVAPLLTPQILAEGQVVCATVITYVTFDPTDITLQMQANASNQAGALPVIGTGTGVEMAFVSGQIPNGPPAPGTPNGYSMTISRAASLGLTSGAGWYQIFANSASLQTTVEWQYGQFLVGATTPR